MIEFFVILLACAWLLYKAYRKKDASPFYVTLLVLLLQLSRWPVYCPIKISFGLMAFVGAGIVFYEHFYKRRDKHAYILLILLVGLGGILLFEGCFANS